MPKEIYRIRKHPGHSPGHGSQHFGAKHSTQNAPQESAPQPARPLDEGTRLQIQNGWEKHWQYAYKKLKGDFEEIIRLIKLFSTSEEFEVLSNAPGVKEINATLSEYPNPEELRKCLMAAPGVIKMLSSKPDTLQSDTAVFLELFVKNVRWFCNEKLHLSTQYLNDTTKFIGDTAEDNHDI